MGGIFGGGEGTSKTKGTSEYPAEFKPLASSSVKQIQQAQDLLPLSMFTGSQPQPVAGLSPFTVAGMELVPHLAKTTQPEQSLMGMQGTWNDLINRAVGFTQPSQAAQSATSSLLGHTGQSLPSQLNPGAAPVSFPQAGPLASNVFGAGVPIPSPQIPPELTRPSVPITPLMPTQAIMPIQPAPAAAIGSAPLTPEQSAAIDQLMQTQAYQAQHSFGGNG